MFASWPHFQKWWESTSHCERFSFASSKNTLITEIICKKIIIKTKLNSLQNYKRVAEVWMDEYKHYIYERNSKEYANVDARNLTTALAIRRKLKCKSFNWFIRNIAFDLFKDFPPRETFEYAWGVVQSQNELKLCADSKNDQQLELSHCGQNLTWPKEVNQFVEFTWRREIRVHNTSNCWDVNGSENVPVKLYRCHRGRGNQLWHLDLVSIPSNFFHRNK